MFIDVDCEIGWLISNWQGLNLYVKDVECDIYIYIYIDWYKLLCLLSWYESVIAIYDEWHEFVMTIESIWDCIDDWKVLIDIYMIRCGIDRQTMNGSVSLNYDRDRWYWPTDYDRVSITELR